MDEMLLYKVAITLIPGVGDINGKKLVAYCGGVRGVFHEKRSALMKIPGVGSALAGGIMQKDCLEMAEKELRYMEKHGIRPLFYLDKDYPARLKHCEDGPMMLYMKGNRLPSATSMLGVVGTRRPTPYGLEVASQVIQDLQDLDIMTVSGLAYGIDTAAHRASLAAEVPTVAVLAHGLDNLYPFVNKPLADKIMDNGALVTEFPSGTKLNRDYFPRRNRIIAGLSDAVLVVESAEKGGALITADIALSYNRDVLAVPGRASDPKSSGCNQLIKTNRAVLVESAADIRFQMAWDLMQQKPPAQQQLFMELNEEETVIWNALPESGEADIDTIYLSSGYPPGKVATILLKLEFDGLVSCLPGKRYKRLR
jgi:DNA processing protein